MKNRNWGPYLIAIAVISTVIILSFVVSTFHISVLIIGILAVIIIVSPFFVHRPEYLFYVFMLFFAFGEVGFHVAPCLPKVSFSNLWIIYSIVILIIRFLARNEKGLVIKVGKRKRKLLLISAALLLLVLYSSVFYGAYRSLLTQFGYFLVTVMVISVVGDRSILVKGIILGFISISLMSVVTIFTSLGLLEFGYRVSWDSDLAPWESILPRAIGLPQMDGGNHNVFILSMLPAAFLLVKRIKGENSIKKLLGIAGIIVCVFAILISLFRSGWLGLIAATAILFFLNWHEFSRSKKKYTLVFLFVVLLGVTAVIVNDFATIIGYLNRTFFEVRGGGVEKRLAQYQFALRKIPSSARAIFIGFGENAIREDFPRSPEAYRLRGELEIGLHNHFLGYMYAYGVFYVIGYVWLVFDAVCWLYEDVREGVNEKGWISKGLLAGFAGCLVILLFTATLSNYKILWVVISSAALLPGFHDEN